MTEDGKVIDDAIKNFGKNYHFYYTTIQPRHNDDINRLLKEGKLDPENEIHNARKFIFSGGRRLFFRSFIEHMG